MPCWDVEVDLDLAESARETRPGEGGQAAPHAQSSSPAQAWAGTPSQSMGPDSGPEAVAAGEVEEAHDPGVSRGQRTRRRRFRRGAARRSCRGCAPSSPARGAPRPASSLPGVGGVLDPREDVLVVHHAQVVRRLSWLALSPSWCRPEVVPQLVHEHAPLVEGVRGTEPRGLKHLAPIEMDESFPGISPARTCRMAVARGVASVGRAPAAPPHGSPARR